MRLTRGNRPVVTILFAIVSLTAGTPAGAGRVASRWVQSRDGQTVVAAAAEYADSSSAVDHHDVRLVEHHAWGVLETALYFSGGAKLFPALRIHGNRKLLGLRLIHRNRRLSLHWVGDRWVEAAAIRGVDADTIGYDRGAVYLYDRAADGTWSRRELLKLEMHHTPVGHQLAQTVAAGGVALTTLFAHPGPPPAWLGLTGIAAAVAAGTCAMWLEGGWLSAVEIGPPTPTDAP